MIPPDKSSAAAQRRRQEILDLMGWGARVLSQPQLAQ
jgi:hypothetical protein